MSNIHHYTNKLFPFVCIALVMVLTSCEDDENTIGASEVTAEFAAETTEVLTDNVVSFNDQSTGDVTHWSWTFEGGTPERSNIENPTVTYKEEGSFEVKLVVSNAAHTSVMAKSEYIKVAASPQPVTADFSTDMTSVLSGESITFTDKSIGGATAWVWKFIPESGEAFSSSEQNPEIVFENPGIYAVKLTASNSKYSDEEIKDAYITVIDASSVAAAFIVDTRSTFAGQNIAFTDMSIGKVTKWEWAFEGGTPASSTEQNPVVTYNSAGSYKVTLVASTDTKAATEERTGYITVIPGEDLVTFLPFDGNSLDAGPLNLEVSNNNGSVSFSGTDRNDNGNSTAVFDGNGALWISAVEEKQLGTSAYTVGVWIKTANPQEMWIWEEGGNDSPENAWFRINNNATTRIYSFLPHLKAIVNIEAAEGRAPLSDDQWHYVVCTRKESGEAAVYVDGTLQHKLLKTANKDLTNTFGFLIGGRDEGSGNSGFLYTGQMDDLVIYKRALSDEEITLLSGF